jgi:hypothetical protein
MAVAEGIPKRNKCGVDGYNVKPLRRGEDEEPYSGKSPKGHYEYFFNMCGHAKGCYQQPSCQVRLREDGKEEIATVTTTGELYTMKWEKLEPKELADLKEKGLGDFKDGVKVNYEIGPMQRSTTIMVPCVEDDNKEVEEGKVTGSVTEGPILHYNIVLPSRHGCPVPVSQLPINIGGGGATKGHFFAIFLFCGLIIYCCVGAWYKRDRLGAQGIEMIPHIDSICAVVECTKGMCSGDGDGMGGMFNKARGVGDDGL